MALRDALPEKIRLCRFTQIVQTYDEEDLATLDEWIANGVTYVDIAKAIETDNPENRTTPTTVLTHLRGRCGCPADTRFKGTR